MTKYLGMALATMMSFLSLGMAGVAQTPATPAPTTTVKLQIVISRYDGDKRIASQPYTLSLVPNEGGSVRVGAEVPVPTGASSAPNVPPPYSLQQLGSQVDATVNPTPDGKYKLSLTVTDRSEYTGPRASQFGGERFANIPFFRNMNVSSKAILGNGETIQFTTALDKVSNETFRIDVTLTVGNK